MAYSGIRAFFDESSDGKSERIFVVAGYVGTEEQWEHFAEHWREELKKFGLTEFHMVDCESGKKQFNGMHRNLRSTMQREFIEIINESGAIGTSTAMLLQDYKQLLCRLQPYLKFPKGLPVSGNLNDPYFLPFKLAIEQVAINSSVWMKDGEQIAFVFDQKNTVQGKAKGFFDDIFKWDRPWAKRIEPKGLKFASKSESVPLQAADVLAYESFRWVDECYLRKKPERWQWKKISRSIKPEKISLIDKEALESLTDALDNMFRGPGDLTETQK